MGVPDLGRVGGVVTARELARVGLTRGVVRALMRQGELMPLGRGVYGRKALVDQARSGRHGAGLIEAVALVAASPGDAAASHHSAALLHGIEFVSGQPPRRAAITREPRPAGYHQPLGAELHVAALPAAHLTTLRGTRVTTAARTVVDLARTLSFAEGVVVADSALRQRKVTRTELGRVLATCARWPGIVRARQTVEFSDPRSESPLESIGRVAFRELGLPRPRLQVSIGHPVDQFFIGRVDFLWDEQRTIAEADGEFKYENPRLARAQLSRDALLREAGYEVVHFGWQEITLVPGQVADAIRAAFGRGALLRSGQGGRVSSWRG